jgi:hypothetical protein
VFRGHLLITVLSGSQVITEEFEIVCRSKQPRFACLNIDLAKIRLVTSDDGDGAHFAVLLINVNGSSLLGNQRHPIRLVRGVPPDCEAVSAAPLQSAEFLPPTVLGQHDPVSNHGLLGIQGPIFPDLRIIVDHVGVRASLDDEYGLIRAGGQRGRTDRKKEKSENTFHTGHNNTAQSEGVLGIGSGTSRRTARDTKARADGGNWREVQENGRVV